MLSDSLETAYMLHCLSYLMGYFINFVSAVFLDSQGVQCVIILCLVVSLPLYLLAEWKHKSYKAGDIEFQVLALYL